MADMYKSEDFSLFLNQILLQSGSGSGHRDYDPIPAGEHFPVNVDNDMDEHECESEDGGFEAMAAEEPARRAPSRNSSKRSRAAEVHNLSEKRRRSRINEKMKALQNLIPNSNKTDKASMLDEAIEYLKQLQLQVQFLTMRNGLSLYPMSLPVISDPTQLSPMNMGFLEGNRPINIDLMGLPHMAQATSTNASIENTGPAHLSGPDISTVIHSGTSLRLGSSVEGPSIPTQQHISSMVSDIFREDVLPHRQLDTDHRQSNLLGTSSTAPVPCETTLSRIKDSAFEAHGLGSRRPDNELLKKLQTEKEIASHFHRKMAVFAWKIPKTDLSACFGTRNEDLKTIVDLKMKSNMEVQHTGPLDGPMKPKTEKHPLDRS